MVSANCENVDAAVKYINWLFSDVAHVMLQHGVEGEHWQYDENGVMADIDKEHNDATRISVGDLCINFAGDPCEFDDKIFAAKRQMQQGERLAKYSINAPKVGTLGKWAPVSMGKIIESEVDYSVDLQENTDNLVINSIMCAPEEFDQTYDKYLKTYMDNGGQAVIDERIAAYKESK